MTPKRRPIQSDDPSLSDEANRLLTDELREAVGHDTMPDGPDPQPYAHEAHATATVLGVDLSGLRLGLIIMVLVLMVTGAVVGLGTGSWWLLLLALAILVSATVATALLTNSMTALEEHTDPATAARLEEEGIADPDRVLTELVHEVQDAERRARP